MVALNKKLGLVIGIACVTMLNSFNTYADIRWEQRGDNWYCFDDNNVPLSGWVDYKNEQYYLDANGVMLTSRFTPDGHYVDCNGEIITYDNCKEMFDSIESTLLNGSANSDLYKGLTSQDIDLTTFKNNKNKEMQDVIQKLHMFNKEVNMSDELAFYVRVIENQKGYAVTVRTSDEALNKWRHEQVTVNNMLNNLAGQTQGLSEREKFHKIVEFLCADLHYDYSLNNVSAYDGLTGNGTVCNGHMKLFSALARKAGLESKLVIGYANNELHGWNQVKIDGVWYHTDLTWYISSERDEYLLLSDSELAQRSIIEIYE